MTCVTNKNNMQLRSRSNTIISSDKQIICFVINIKKKLKNIMKESNTNLRISKVIEMLIYMLSENVWVHSKQFKHFRSSTNKKMDDLSLEYTCLSDIMSNKDKQKLKYLIQQIKIITKD
jgi:hypothetical protein